MSGCGAHNRLISGDCPSQAILKSMTAVEVSSFPSVFKEGWLRLNKKVPFLSADGVVSKRSRSLLRKHPRSAPYLLEFTNHPVCAAKERALFNNGAASHPSLKTEGNGPFSQPTYPLHLASQPVG